MPILLSPMMQAGISESAPAPQQGYFTADALQKRCSDPQPQSVTACFTFVAAVVDTSRAYQQWLNFREFCLPAGITQGELREATLQYLDIHRREGDAQAASVVVLALKDAYPCPVSTGAPPPAAGTPTMPPPAPVPGEQH